MGVQTGEDKFKGISATNYIVGAIQRKIFSRSNIAFLLVDKNVLNPEIGVVSIGRYREPARVAYR